MARRDPGELRTLALMGLTLAAVMPLAAWLGRPFQATAPVDLPQDPTQAGDATLLAVGAIVFVLLAIAMAALVLWAARAGRRGIIQTMVLAAVAVALLVAMARPVLWLSTLIHPDLAWGLGLAVAAGLAFLLWRRPTWTLMNAVGFLVAASVAGLAGAVLGVTPVLFLLVAVAVYDAVAVHRTKHMQKLARAAIQMRLPVALRFGGAPARRGEAARPGRRTATPPRDTEPATPTPHPEASAPQGTPAHAGRRVVASEAGSTQRTAPADPGDGPASAAAPVRRARRPAGILMGVGDLVFPATLFSAATHVRYDWGVLPPLLCAAGVLVGYMILVRAALRGGAQAGLPLLNGGAVLGFLLGLLLATGSLRFW